MKDLHLNLKALELKRLFNKLLFAAFTLLSVITFASCNSDGCDNIVCLNKGTCDAGKCKCATGYEGTRCESLATAKFTRTKAWIAEDSLSTGLEAYTVRIYKDSLPAPTANNLVSIGTSFLGGYYANELKASVTDYKITLPLQEPDMDGRMISGAGKYTNGTIEWTYYLEEPNVDVDTVISIWR